jgi:outer membrane immunogenic protein
MKNSVFAAIAASAVALAAMPAAAQSLAAPTFYGNLGYSFVDAGNGVNLGAITGRLGARFDRYFGAEAEGAFGVDNDHTTVSSVDVRTKLNHSVAAYAVGFLPVTPQFELFARGGYGSSQISVSAPTFSQSASEGSWNYGGGVQYMFDSHNGLRGEFTRHDFRHDAGSADVWAASYVRKF